MSRVGLLPWALVAGGVVLAGGGGVFLFLGKKKQDDVDGAPVRDRDDLEHLVDLEDEADRDFKIGAGLAIAGGAVAATGVVLGILRMRAGGGEPSSSVSVGLAPAPGGVGLTVSMEVP